MKTKTLIYFAMTTCLTLSFPYPLSAANQESLKKLEALVPRKSEEALKGALELSGTDMRSYNLCSSKKGEKVDFTKANLKGANFSGMEICNVDFEGANLEQANFEGAHITKCNFRHVTGPANFTGTSIKYTGFNHAKLGQSLFIHALIESTSFDFADLKNTSFNQSTLIAVNFYSADLTGYSHDATRMERTNFERSIGTSWFD